MNNYNTIKCDSSEIGLARKFKTQTSDATNDFRIMSIELEDGEPKVEWEPKTNRWTGAEIRAVLKGAESLAGPWAEVPAGGNPTFRFFKVVVEGP